MRFRVLMFCWCVLGWASHAHAQQGPPKGHATKPATPKRAKQLRERLRGHVLIPLRRMHALLPTSKPAFSPRVSVLGGTFQGSVQKRLLVLKAQLRLEVKPGHGFHLYRLGARQGLLRNVTCNGKAFAPLRRGDGYWLPLPAGTLELRYEVRRKLPRSRGSHQLDLDLPKATRARLRLRFPGAGWDVRTEPASQVTRSQKKKEHMAELQLPATGKVRLIWKGKRIERRQQTRFRAKVETLITLQEGLLLGRATLRLELLTGALRTLTFRLPRTMEVLHVGGAGVAEWYQSHKDKTWKHFTVQLSRAVRTQLAINLRFERTRLPTKAPVQLPNIQLPKAEQSTGFLGVLAQADTEVSHHKAQGATQVDVRSLPKRIRTRSDRPILLAYQFEQPRYQLSVRMVKHPWLKVLSTVVNNALFETVRTRAGREMTKATYWVTNNRRQFMPLRLPKGSKIVGAFVAGRSIQPAIAPKQQGHAKRIPGETYLIPLVSSSGRGIGKKFAVELLYTQSRKALQSWGSFRTQLPATPLEVLSFRWVYYLPRSHRHIWVEGSIKPSWQQRFLKRLEHRLQEDYRAGGRKLWAGGGKPRLNVYNFLGLKERFAAPLASTPKSAARRRSARHKRYRSRFDRFQQQIRAKLPLVGRTLRFKGHLLRQRAPHVKIWVLQSSLNKGWYALALFLTALCMLLFVHSIFRQGGIGWMGILVSLLVWGALVVVGYLIPLTYLAGLRGALYGFWASCLLLLATLNPERSYLPVIYIRIARWWSVAITFLFLLTDSIAGHISLLFFAFPVYPAFFRRNAKPPTPPTPPGSPPPEPPDDDTPPDDKEGNDDSDTTDQKGTSDTDIKETHEEKPQAKGSDDSDTTEVSDTKEAQERSDKAKKPKRSGSKSKKPPKGGRR